MKKLLYSLLFILSFPISSFSQEFDVMVNKFMFRWEMAVPTSGFLKDASAAGFRFEYRRMLSPYFSLGIATSWNSFAQYEPRQTYTSPDGNYAISTDVYKDVYTWPITV